MFDIIVALLVVGTQLLCVVIAAYGVYYKAANPLVAIYAWSFYTNYKTWLTGPLWKILVTVVTTVGTYYLLQYWNIPVTAWGSLLVAGVIGLHVSMITKPQLEAIKPDWEQ